MDRRSVVNRTECPIWKAGVKEIRNSFLVGFLAPLLRALHSPTDRYPVTILHFLSETKIVNGTDKCTEKRNI